MNAWLQFLNEHGARVDTESGETVFGEDDPQSALADGYVAPLTDLGLIAASGGDAANFLHNQLTNDVERLPPSEARLAGYCSPKGRLLATFLMWRTADEILLQLPRQIQAPVQKRLQMFVLRAKAKLQDASDRQVMLGIGGRTAEAALAKHFPALPAAPYAAATGDNGTLIRMADAFGTPRYQWIVSCEQAADAWSELTTALTPVSTGVWRLADIDAGIPRIVQATQEQFVPQMVNFEVVGGVNFKKGCYPGQEIVARSQYLGKLKRRMYAATIDAGDARAGMDVFSGGDPGQPCGMIVNAERQPQGGIACLVELKSAAVDAGTVHLGSASGPLLQLRALPYALPDTAA